MTVVISACRSFRRAAGGQHIVEIAQVITHAGQVQHAAQTAGRHAQSVGAAKSAELSAPFQVRLQIEKYARNSPAAEFFLQGRDLIAKIAQR